MEKCTKFGNSNYPPKHEKIFATSNLENAK